MTLVLPFAAALTVAVGLYKKVDVFDEFIKGARENNLRNIDVKFPLGEFICVTGISGSGKSSLINEILYKTLACELNGARSRAGKCDGVEGLEFVDKVIGIDQQPIGRTPPRGPRPRYNRRCAWYPRRARPRSAYCRGRADA